MQEPPPGAEQLSHFFDLDLDLLCVADTDGRLLRVSRAWEKVLGHDPEELIGTFFLDLVHPDDLNGTLATLGALAAGQEVRGFVNRYRHSDGSYRWMEWRASPAEPNLIYASAHDISERHDAQQRLKVAEGRYRHIAEHLHEVFFALDDEGRLQYISPQVLPLFGVEPEMLLRISFAEVIPPEDRQRAAALFERAAEAPVGPITQRIVDFQGRSHHLSIVAAPADDEAGEIAVVGSCLDVTEAVASDEQRQAAEAERQRVEKRLRRTLGRLNKSVDAAVNALARTVEMRDPYTAGHQERVSELAVATGRRLELPPKAITSLRIAGLIHDLGKMAIPAEILTKPSALNEPEWMLMRRHSDTAYEILHEMRFPGPVARIVRDHHERLDGSGYPRGLGRDKIRLESMILAVADVVEAMSAHRPYRAALGIEAALAQVERGRGELYDSEVVDACLALFREEGFAFSSQK